MAKAALNMMTLTGARDYARDGILMNSADTGKYIKDKEKEKWLMLGCDLIQ